MRVSIEHASGLERRIRVEVAASGIEDAIDKRLRDLGRSLKLKGFRQGKVPDKVIRQRYGTEIRRQVLQEFLQRTCREAIQQQGLEAVGPARIEQQPETETDLVFVATFETYPEITVRGLERLTAERPVVAINEADIDELILRLRKQRRSWTAVDRPAREGDRVTIDFQGILDGEPLAEARGERVPLVIGEAELRQDIRSCLTGARAGDRLGIEVTYAGGFPDDLLAGRAVRYELVVHEIAEACLPDVDPEFCRSFGVESGALSDLRAAAAEDMIREAAIQVRDELRLQLLSQLSEATQMELPLLLCDQEISRLQQHALRRAGLRHIADIASRSHFRQIAERNVRMGLIIRHLFKNQRLRILREEVNDKIAAACMPGEDVEQKQLWYFEHPEMLQQIEYAVMDHKVVDWLIQRASITDKSMTFVELMDMRRGKWGRLIDVKLRVFQ